MTILSFPDQVEILANRAKQADDENAALKYSQAALNLAHITSHNITKPEASTGARGTTGPGKVQPKKGWINIYAEGECSHHCYESKGQAYDRRAKARVLLTIAEVEWFG